MAVESRFSMRPSKHGGLAASDGVGFGFDPRLTLHKWQGWRKPTFTGPT